MKNGLTEIVVILDKSGSMKKIQGKTIEGFNEFLDEQKKIDGDANLSLILFGSPNREQILFDSIDIQNIGELSDKTYVTAGTTALYDCLGKSIKSVKMKIKKTDKDERPDKVLFVIITDGEENSSKMFDKEMVFELIEKRERKDEWGFVYLGANQDSFLEGSKIGISKGKTLNFDYNDKGTKMAYMSTTNYVKQYRMSTSKSDANKINIEK